MSNTRQHQADQARALIASGKSQAAVAALLGLSPPTLCRMLKEGGREPETRAQCQTRLSPAERQTLKRLILQTNSRRIAAEDFLHEEVCSDEVAREIHAVLADARSKGVRPNWPVWFRRETIITNEDRLLFRGPKAAQAIKPSRPRGAFYEVVENGVVIRKDLFANALWESDDQSENTPSLSIDPATGKPQLNRQTLFTVDVFSAFILGFNAVQRKKDCYTLEDQAAHALELVEAHGLPLAWRIERGPWDNSFWWGVSLDRTWWRTNECPDYRWGGLDLSAGGPIAVLEAFESRQKGTIEGTFNHLQNLNAHTSRDIGRYRGEHEKAAKMARKIDSLRKRGASLTDGEIKEIVRFFPSAWERAELTVAAVERFNGEAKMRRMHGKQMLIPAELYRSALRREMPASEKWRFLPMKKAVKVPRGVNLSFTDRRYEGREFLFSLESFEPAWDWAGSRHLPVGWEIFCAFHPLRPDLGCHIFNGVHESDPRNLGRFPRGMFLGIAEPLDLAPQFRIGGRVAGEEDPHAKNKEHMRNLRGEARMMLADQPRVVRSSLALVGGNIAAQRNTPDPLAALRPTTLSTEQQSDGMPDMLSPRSRVDHLAGSGGVAGRGGLDHEARPNNSAGETRMSIAELEAREAELLAEAGIF